MASLPHNPFPPVIIFPARFSRLPWFNSYVFAICRYDGPVLFLSISWQPRQSFVAINLAPVFVPDVSLPSPPLLIIAWVALALSLAVVLPVPDLQEVNATNVIITQINFILIQCILCIITNLIPACLNFHQHRWKQNHRKPFLLHG